jgi:serine/threonine-protein kinase
VARAVQAAHSQGVIHRDLKPANVLLQELPAGAAVAGAVPLPGGSLGVPKVTDFGLALREGGAPLTSTGLVVGTPAYMAPEQARGDRTRVGPATDVHALGVILYELLTARPPFQSEDPMTVLGAVAASDPRAPRRLRPQIPRDLDTVCMKCLAKEPGQRYASAAPLADDLARFLEDKPILARRPGFRQVAARWARRHKAVVWAAAVVLLVVAVVGGGGGLREVQRRARADGEAQAALQEALALRQQQKWPEARSAVRRAKGVLAGVWADEALRQEVEELDRDVEMALRLQEARLRGAAQKRGYFDTEAISAAYAEAFAWYGLRLESVDARPAGDFLRSRCIGLQLAAALDHWASLRQRGSKGRSQLLAIARVADPDPWRDRLRDALERPDPRALKELVASARAEELRPATAVLLARVAKGTAEAERAVAVLRQAQQRHPDDFWVNRELGWCLYKVRPPRLEEAICYYSVAVALRPQSPGARLKLGLALKDKGRMDEAIECFYKAVELDPTYAGAHTSLGLALQGQGKVDEAIECFHKAIALDPRLAYAHINLGLAMKAKGKLDEAIACYKKAFEIEPGLALAHTNLGIALKVKGKVGEAIECYHKAIELEPGLAQVHGALAQALMQRGQVSEAQTALRRCRTLLPPSDPLRGVTSGLLRQCQQQLEADGKLKAFLAGTSAPADAATQVQLASRAQQPYQRFYLTAAQLYRDAFARQPQLANAHRYNAAGAAALAGCGQGKDAAALGQKQRAS